MALQSGAAGVSGTVSSMHSWSINCSAITSNLVRSGIFSTHPAVTGKTPSGLTGHGSEVYHEKGYTGSLKTSMRTGAEETMKQRRMGRTGLKVSEICLGTMTFAGQSDETKSFRILDVATERGVTFIDTADAYPIPPDPESAGRTEEVIGR